MTNTMTGRVLSIGNVEEIPSRNGGESFKKRTVVLNCTRSDFGKVYESYPSFEFTGKHLDDPTNFKVDDIVTISFALQGTKYQKNPDEPAKYFNTISGYKIETYQSKGNTQPRQAPTQTPTQELREQDQGAKKDDDLPF